MCILRCFFFSYNQKYLIDLQTIKKMVFIPLISLLFIVYFFLVAENIKIWKIKYESSTGRRPTWRRLMQMTWKTTTENMLHFLLINSKLNQFFETDELKLLVNWIFLWFLGSLFSRWRSKSESTIDAGASFFLWFSVKITEFFKP